MRAIKTLAVDVRVGDTVEFEAGDPVVVDAIEENYSPSEDPSPYYLKRYGRSLAFHCKFDCASDFVPTLYIRRELSPVSDRSNRVVR